MEAPAARACRICQGEGEPLIRPCRCEGSMAYAHPYCLAEWIASRGHLYCEVCGTAYTFQLAVSDAPSLRSVRGVARITKLVVTTQLRRFFAKVGVAGRVLGGSFLLAVGTTLIWFCCLCCVARRSWIARWRRAYLPWLFVVGFLINVIPGILLLCYERFTEWAFIFEDDIADLPPEPPMQPPPETPVDEAAAEALNRNFMNARPGHDEDHSVNSSTAAQRYVAVQLTGVSTTAVLELLRKKVSETASPGQRHRIGDGIAVGDIGVFLFFHVALASAIVLGDALLRCVAHSTRLLTTACHRFTTPDSYSVAWVLFTETLTAGPLSSFLYWFSVLVVGMATLLYPARWAAAGLARTHTQLSRTVSLCCVFSRSAVSLVVVVTVWVCVVPVVVYAGLFPFFVEGDATVIMPPREAWQTLRSERLLPFRCRGVSPHEPHPPLRAVSQPLNVIRALLFAAPDVWRGQAPPLFDPVSCRLNRGRATPPLPPASQAAHFLCFAGCVLLRVCTLPTWLSLVGTLRATLLWLLSGTFTVLLPHTSLASCFFDYHEFFHAFTRLSGGTFWRVLLQIPALIALYTVTVGFTTFVTLNHFHPDAFPRSVSYLSFYTLANHFSEFDFMYSWLRVINAAHNAAQAGLHRLFLTRGNASTDNELASPADETVERVAYVVCLLCANVLIGFLLERASWSSWFPFLGFFLNLGCASVLAMAVGGGFPFVRRWLNGWKMQATMLGFHGMWVTFKDGDVCVCRKLSRVRPNPVTSDLLLRLFVHNDVQVLPLVSALLDDHHRETVVCSRDAVQRVTVLTLSHIATYPRMAAGAFLAAVAPLVLCTAWHLDFATRVSTDYVALPLWCALLVRWVTGAVAAAAWVVVEGCVLRTALFQRALEFAPQLILGGPSMEVVHAVFIPFVIHGCAVRLLMAALEYVPAGSPVEVYWPLPIVVSALAIGLSMMLGRIRHGLWRAIDRVVRERRPPPERAIAALPVDLAAPVHGAAGPPPQLPHLQPQPPEEPAAMLHDAAEAVAADAADGNARDAAPATETVPPAPQKPSFMSRVQERVARWAASECATDVVLTDYAPPTPFSADLS